MNQRFKKISAYFLLSVFFVAFAPKELIHELVCHHEVTTPVKSNETTIAKAPVNCIFLQQHFVSFTSSEEVTIHAVPVLYSEEIFSSVSIPVQLFSGNNESLRGPPVV